MSVTVHINVLRRVGLTLPAATRTDDVIRRRFVISLSHVSHVRRLQTELMEPAPQSVRRKAPGHSEQQTDGLAALARSAIHPLLVIVVLGASAGRERSRRRGSRRSYPTPILVTRPE